MSRCQAFATLIFLAILSNSHGSVLKNKNFICQRSSGHFHFPDPETPSKFYKCHHGHAYRQDCPISLHWNQAIQHCDWPEKIQKAKADIPKVDKKVTKPVENHWILTLPDPKEFWKEEAKVKSKSSSPDISSVDKFSLDISPPDTSLSKSSSLDVSLPDTLSLSKSSTNKKYIYLTFDDGPNSGTDFVLDALAKTNVKATFFINSYQLPWTKKIFLNLIDGGHVLADHSFDHMKDNSQGTSWNAYQNVENDLKNFGTNNANAVSDFLMSNGRRNSMEPIRKTLDTYVRLPYTNNWRVPSMNISHDCPTCTSPTASGQNGIEIADRLAATGKKVIGWDKEWLGSSSLQHGGSYTFQQLKGVRTQDPGKIVLLMHDRAFSNSHANNELKTFIELAKADGYTFSTVDKYETDKLSVSDQIGIM